MNWFWSQLKLSNTGKIRVSNRVGYRWDIAPLLTRDPMRMGCLAPVFDAMGSRKTAMTRACHGNFNSIRFSKRYFMYPVFYADSKSAWIFQEFPLWSALERFLGSKVVRLYADDFLLKWTILWNFSFEGVRSPLPETFLSLSPGVIYIRFRRVVSPTESHPLRLWSGAFEKH